MEILLDNKVGVNDFVRRQSKNSGKTYSELSYEEIALYAQNKISLGQYIEGYRKGVILVEITDEKLKKFTCPFVKIENNTRLIAEVAKRRENEEPYIRIKALNGDTLPLGKVELILYSHNVLKETDENTTDCDWELISFHGIPANIEKMPMGPVTMMRNQLQLTGGTRAEYSSEEWAESVNFWQKYAIKETDVNNGEI